MAWHRRLVALAVAGAAVAVAAPAGASEPDAPAGTQRLALLERARQAYTRPDTRSPHLTTVARRRPITGTRTMLPVLDLRAGRDGTTWLRVMLPGRPNGRTGWISSRFTKVARTSWRLRVDLSRRQVTVLRSGEVVRTFRAVIGTPSTPTPVGRFFVEESIRFRRDQVGAPYALALSARSAVLEQFAGGPGQIGIHGMGNVGGVPGTAASHGCMRLRDGPIRWLAARVGPGVPVTIVA